MAIYVIPGVTFRNAYTRPSVSGIASATGMEATSIAGKTTELLSALKTLQMMATA